MMIQKNSVNKLSSYVNCLSLIVVIGVAVFYSKSVNSGINDDRLYPDLILHNAVILTMDHRQSVVQAMALSGDKILAVGSDRSISKLKGRNTRVVNMQGHTIMPGIVDAHTHLFNDFTDETPDLRAAQEVAIEFGITTLGNLFATPEIIDYMRTYVSRLKVRTSLYLSKTTNCGIIDSDWYLDYPPTRNPGEMLRIGGIKVMTDGGSRCSEDYWPRPAVSVERTPGGGLGDLFHSQGQIDEIVKSAHQAGYQVAIHAIGDRGMEQALNAIEFALDGEPNTMKHRIEHNGVLTHELIQRYGEVGAIPTIFGYKRTCWLPDEMPAFYQQAENAYRSLIEENPRLPVAWHGDDPVVEPINPFIDMYSLVTRIDVMSEDQPCYPPEWLANQALTVEQVLRTMTMGAAYALDRDEEVGSLMAGKFADLIVLSDNPLTVDHEMLKDIEVKATMIGGKYSFQN